MVFNETEKQEKEYLQKILSIIHATINNTDKSVKDHVDTLQEYKDYLWSNKDIDPHEIRSMRESILNHFALGENVIDDTDTVRPDSRYSLFRTDRFQRRERWQPNHTCLYWNTHILRLHKQDQSDIRLESPGLKHVLRP